MDLPWQAIDNKFKALRQKFKKEEPRPIQRNVNGKQSVKNTMNARTSKATNTTEDEMLKKFKTAMVQSKRAPKQLVASRLNKNVGHTLSSLNSIEEDGYDLVRK